MSNTGPPGQELYYFVPAVSELWNHPALVALYNHPANNTVSADLCGFGMDSADVGGDFGVLAWILVIWVVILQIWNGFR